MTDSLKNIKKQFFAFRNGIIADALRRQSPYKIIFGLQIPQIAEIARSLNPDMDLASALWDDKEVRESRLLATYLFPTELIDMDKALSLAAEANTVEEKDMLAFRLFKRLPFPTAFLEEMKSHQELSDYMRKKFSNHLS